MPTTWNRPSPGPAADYSTCRCAVCHRVHSCLRHINESSLRFRFLGQEISRCVAGATETNLKNDTRAAFSYSTFGLAGAKIFCRLKSLLRFGFRVMDEPKLKSRG